MNEVQKFLKRFHLSDDIDTVFTCGCCYWFAMIMLIRFADKNPRLMYDDIINHFGCEIGGIVYDVTGDVTDKYKWIPWESITDELHRERIRQQCIMF